jgi:tetratricopeptide (TPR) repeat protein
MAEILAVQASHGFPKERLAALEAAGGLAYWQGDMDDAQRLYDECVELTRPLGDERAIANALYNAAFPRTITGRTPKDARPMFSEALALFRKTGDDEGIARTLWGMGLTFYYLKDFAGGVRFSEEAEVLNRKLDNRFGLAWSLHTLGLSAYRLGDVERARTVWLEAIQLFEAAGEVPGLVFQLANLSAIADHDGDPLRGARLEGAATAHRLRSGAELGQHVLGELLRPGLEGSTDTEVAKAFAEGQRMSLGQAVAYALEGADRTTPTGRG